MSRQVARKTNNDNRIAEARKEKGSRNGGKKRAPNAPVSSASVRFYLRLDSCIANPGALGGSILLLVFSFVSLVSFVFKL